MIEKVGLGGGCHWCTESIFLALAGVLKVEQGWILPTNNSSFSEAVIVHFDSSIIGLKNLIEVHLNTHSSTSNHSMRSKYRSSVYTFSKTQFEVAETLILGFQKHFENKLITKVQAFKKFKPSIEQYQNYYKKNPQKPFCERYIKPKLKILEEQFADRVNLNNDF